MLLILFMSIISFVLLKKSLINFDSKSKRKIYIFVAMGIIVELVLFIVYRLNLKLVGRNVYYSDAEVYWINTLEILKTQHSYGYNPLYYYSCALAQITSPFLWVGWNNLFNIACINLSLAISIYLLPKKENKIIWLVILTIYNPFVIYGLMRNLKDALFMLMIFITLIIYKKLINEKTKNIKIIYFSLLLMLVYLFLKIRPWGFIIPCMAIMFFCIKLVIEEKELIKKNLNIFLPIAILIVIIILYVITPTIKVWLPVVFKSITSRSVFETILGFGKFVFGPGPYRCIYGSKYFQFYLTSGNIMCAIGQIMWWLSAYMLFVGFILGIKNKKIKIDYLSLYFISIVLIYITIYTLEYGGSAEIRLRSVLIFLLSVCGMLLYDLPQLKQNKKYYIITGILFIFMYIGITIAGL